MHKLKLKPDNFSTHELSTAKENFLNETRFAQCYARGKFRLKKWGRRRITNELKKRNISKFNIKIGLKEIIVEEYQIIQQIQINGIKRSKTVEDIKSQISLNFVK